MHALYMSDDLADVSGEDRIVTEILGVVLPHLPVGKKFVRYCLV